MAEYIEREALIKKLEDRITNPTNAFINNVLIGLLEKAPAADVAEVRHGKWLTWEEQFPDRKPTKKNNLGVFCNNCHSHADNMTDFCPNCGARMDGETE